MEFIQDPEFLRIIGEVVGGLAFVFLGAKYRALWILADGVIRGVNKYASKTETEPNIHVIKDVADECHKKGVPAEIVNTKINPVNTH